MVFPASVLLASAVPLNVKSTVSPLTLYNGVLAVAVNPVTVCSVPSYGTVLLLPSIVTATSIGVISWYPSESISNTTSKFVLILLKFVATRPISVLPSISSPSTTSVLVAVARPVYLKSALTSYRLLSAVAV